MVSSHARISIEKYLEEWHQTGNSFFKEGQNTFGKGFPLCTLYFYDFWSFKMSMFNFNNQKKKLKQNSVQAIWRETNDLLERITNPHNWDEDLIQN